MSNDKKFKVLITSLDGLCKRLQDNYNNGIIFEQYEEDRLIIYNVIEILEKTKKLVDFELSMYPCNDTLEEISRYLTGDFENYER